MFTIQFQGLGFGEAKVCQHIAGSIDGLDLHMLLEEDIYRTAEITNEICPGYSGFNR